MFRSLRTRISLVIGGVIIGTTAALCYTAQHEVRRFFVAQEDLAAINILNAITAGVNNEYRSIKFSRDQQLNQRKEELRNLLNVVIRLIDQEWQKSQKGLISEEEAQKRAKDLIRPLRYDNNAGYFWITNSAPKSVKLVHGLMPELEGTYDAAEYDFIVSSKEPLQQYFYRNCQATGECYAEYNWPKSRNGGYSEAVPKISYVRLFKPWNWLVGTGMYVDDIDRTEQLRLKAVIKELRDTATKLRIGDNGYAFIFDSNLKMLVHPVYANSDDFFLPQTDDDRRRMAGIVAACKSGQSRYNYQWLKPGEKEKKYHDKTVFVEYFQPLDFYICISYYTEDLEKPILALNMRLMILSVVLLLISLGAALLLAWSLAAPLRRLMKAAQFIGQHGTEAADIPVSGSRETCELGQILAQVIETIRQKELSLKASEENLRITLASIGDAVIATDTVGRIVRMNHAAEEITEWQFDDACGKVLTEGVKLADMVTAEPIGNPIDAVLSSGEACNLARKTVLITKNGTRKLIDDSCAPIISRDNQLLGVVIAFRDITAQVQMELQLLQAQKMDSLGQLAGGVAHDFNNMLGGIMSSAEMLKRKLPPELPRLLEYANMIISTSERAADLTGKLLAFARKGKIFSSPTDVHSSIIDAIALLSRSIDKRVVISSDLSADRFTIVGDSSQLQTMILNLGINAAHAMPDGGTLRIATRNISLDETFCRNCREFNVVPGEYIEISIEDKGTGIAPENMPRIFEPFFTTKQIGHGTGLGLASVYGSVKDHHGLISVRSILGEGTVFTILLPLAENSEALSPSPLLPQATHFRGEILLVDDEPIIRAATGAILEETGVTVVQAAEGEEALAIFRQNPQRFGLVIMDMGMPRMNGEDCFIAMKKINPDVKVVLISGFTNEIKELQMKEKGLVELLRKPFRREDLLMVMSRCLPSEGNGGGASGSRD